MVEMAYLTLFPPLYALSTLLLLALGFGILLEWRNQRLLPPSPVALPIIGHLHLLGPLVHQSIHNLSLSYGPLISLKLGSVRCVVASSPAMARECLKTNEPSFLARMDSIATRKLTYESAYAFSPYGPYWKFMNKLVMTKLLSPRALTRFFPVQYDELKHMLRSMARCSDSGTIVNITQEMLKLANNVICHMILGIRRSDRHFRGEEARALVCEVTQIFGEFNVSDFIWLVKGLDLQRFNGRIEDTYNRFDSLMESIIKNKEEMRSKMSDDHVKDFLDLLLDATEDEGSEIRLTRGHIKGLIMDFMTAGTHTSATSTEWTLSELINNPRILNKAQEEIDRVVGKDHLVQESDLPNLLYLQAIMKESFRLHPPVPLIVRRSTVPSNINGYHIPANSLLMTNNWTLGRDPKSWDGPMDFRPERFLQPGNGDPVGLSDLKGTNFQLLPFGSGRRGCPGANLALQQVPLVLAALLQCFELKVSPSMPGVTDSGLLDMNERPGLSVPRAYDLMCVPVPRIDLSKIIH